MVEAITVVAAYLTLWRVISFLLSRVFRWRGTVLKGRIIRPDGWLRWVSGVVVAHLLQFMSDVFGEIIEHEFAMSALMKIGFTIFVFIV